MEDLETIEVLVADLALAEAKIETEARCSRLSVVNVVGTVKFLSVPMVVNQYFVAPVLKPKAMVVDQVEMVASLVVTIDPLRTEPR